MFLRLYCEQVNLRDENAIVAQVKDGLIWKTLGYIPAKKAEKVTAALNKREIVSVKLDQIYRQYIFDIAQFRLIAKVAFVKNGKWKRDNDKYKYNDRMD